MFEIISREFINRDVVFLFHRFSCRFYLMLEMVGAGGKSESIETTSCWPRFSVTSKVAMLSRCCTARCFGRRQWRIWFIMLSEQYVYRKKPSDAQRTRGPGGMVSYFGPKILGGTQTVEDQRVKQGQCYVWIIN